MHVVHGSEIIRKTKCDGWKNCTLLLNYKDMYEYKDINVCDSNDVKTVYALTILYYYLDLFSQFV